MQRTGREHVLQALDEMAAGGHVVHLILVKEGEDQPGLAERLEHLNVKLIEVTKEDMWRMRATDKGDPTILALVGREPHQEHLSGLMNSPGPIWMMCGVAYASNLGLSIRTAEASGAAGVVITPVASRRVQRSMGHFSMGSDRFLPVFWEDDASHVITEAKQAGRPIFALETTGTTPLKEINQIDSALWLIGGEHDGIPPELLKESDAVISLPFGGFVPSYNLQTAMSVVAIEILHRGQFNHD